MGAKAGASQVLSTETEKMTRGGVGGVGGRKEKSARSVKIRLRIAQSPQPAPAPNAITAPRMDRILENGPESQAMSLTLRTNNRLGSGSRRRGGKKFEI